MKSTYNGTAIPSNGTPIEYSGEQFRIADRPILPYIEGDGTGRDIWKASRRVFDAAVEKAYGGKRRIAWYEVFAGCPALPHLVAWGSFRVPSLIPQDAVLPQSGAQDHFGHRTRFACRMTVRALSSLSVSPQVRSRPRQPWSKPEENSTI